MVVSNDAWRASAAYLYVLLLEGPSLAWEYLRRNPDYRRDWHARAEMARAQRAGAWPRWKTLTSTRAWRDRSGSHSQKVWCA